jgi:hypothetical protein
MRYKLEKCLELRRDINSIDERIAELKLRIRSPKNQIISDMPKGNSRNNSIEEYLITLEKLESKKIKYNSRITDKWQLIYNKLINNGVSEEAITMLRYRFYYGYSWKVCADLMNWNKNKCFRVYRAVLSKFNK